MNAIRIFLLFGISGVIGYFVDIAVLYALKDRYGLYNARAASFFCAVFVTWVINRNITFRARRSRFNASAEFIRYITLMLGGGAVNYVVFLLLVKKFLIIMKYPFIGVAIGSLSGMVINLLTSRWLIYRYAPES